MNCFENISKHTYYNYFSKKTVVKFEINKIILESTLLQEILNGFTIIFIDKILVSQLEYENLIAVFAFYKLKNEFYLSFWCITSREG